MSVQPVTRFEWPGPVEPGSQVEIAMMLGGSFNPADHPVHPAARYHIGIGMSCRANDLNIYAQMLHNDILNALNYPK